MLVDAKRVTRHLSLCPRKLSVSPSSDVTSKDNGLGRLASRCRIWTAQDLRRTRTARSGLPTFGSASERPKMLDKPPAAHHLYQPSSVRYRSGVLAGSPITRSSVHDVLIRRHSLLYHISSSSSP